MRQEPLSKEAHLAVMLPEEEIKKMRTLIVAALMGLFLPQSLMARTWYVRCDGGGDAPTIQAAIDSTSAGDTILVGTGIHEVTGKIICYDKDELTFIGEGIEGAAAINGPGIFIIEWSAYIAVRNLTFSNCSLSLYWTSSSIVEGNHFLGSSILVECGGPLEICSNLLYSSGAAISCGDYPVATRIHHNVIAFNIDGPGIVLDAGQYNIFNNIIAFNRRGIYSISTAVYLDCNNVWGNQEFNYRLTFFPDPTGTNGNISADPQFCGVNPDISGNFYLQSDSPCAPGNHPDGFDCGIIGKYSVGCGSVSAMRSSWGEIKGLFREERRRR
jgi:hypothetical protein